MPSFEQTHPTTAQTKLLNISELRSPSAMTREEQEAGMDQTVQKSFTNTDNAGRTTGQAKIAKDKVRHDTHPIIVHAIDQQLTMAGLDRDYKSTASQNLRSTRVGAPAA